MVGCDPQTHRAVTLAAASDAPPLRLLRGAFDLAPFGGLLLPSPAGAMVSAAAAVEAQRKKTDWLVVLEEHGSELGGIFGAAARRSRARLLKELRSSDGANSGSGADGADKPRPEGGTLAGANPIGKSGAANDEEQSLLEVRIEGLGVSDGQEWCFAQELCSLLDRRGPAWGWQGAGLLGSAALAALCSPACTGAPDRDAWPIARQQRGGMSANGGLIRLKMPDSPVARVG